MYQICDMQKRLVLKYISNLTEIFYLYKTTVGSQLGGVEMNLLGEKKPSCTILVKEFLSSQNTKNVT